MYCMCHYSFAGTYAILRKNLLRQTACSTVIAILLLKASCHRMQDLRKSSFHQGNGAFLHHPP